MARTPAGSGLEDWLIITYCGGPIRDPKKSVTHRGHRGLGAIFAPRRIPLELCKSVVTGVSAVVRYSITSGEGKLSMKTFLRRDWLLFSIFVFTLAILCPAMRGQEGAAGAK